MQFLQNISNLLSPEIEAAIQADDPWYWALKSQIRLVPGPFSLMGHEFQVRPMSMHPPVKVFRKATQMTVTESEVLNVLHGMIYGKYPVGVYYLFPNKDKVSEFSKSRFKPLINDNPETIGAYIRDTDSVNIKRIGSGFLYFRSGRLAQEIEGQMKTSANLKGDPADHAVHDEYDEMDPKIDEFIDGRLAKSRVQTKSYLANPTLPDYGIDRKFQESDQEYWFIKCQHCGHWTCLDYEENFPKLFHEQRDGTVIRACEKCGRALDPRFGQWVAKRPEITDVIGFTIGHPSAHWINPKKLLQQFRKPRLDLANFTRLQLGRAYIEAEHRLSIEEVLSLCSDKGIASSSDKPCTMGVDVGNALHVVIGRKHPRAFGEIVHINDYRDFTNLDRLMEAFHVSLCVIDALPETRSARAFAERHKGKVYLNYYNEHQKGSYAWNEKEYIVQCNRTESLDASHTEIAEESVILPKRCAITEEFADHIHNVAKKLEEDPETGSKRYVYIKLGPDHYRHAYNYECMARQNAPEYVFDELH